MCRKQHIKTHQISDAAGKVMKTGRGEFLNCKINSAAKQRYTRDLSFYADTKRNKVV